MIFTRTCFDFREYIDKNIVDFARKNPGIAIYVREQNGKHPTIIANFSKLFLYYTYSHILMCLPNQIELNSLIMSSIELTVGPPDLYNVTILLL